MDHAHYSTLMLFDEKFLKEINSAFSAIPTRTELIAREENKKRIDAIQSRIVEEEKLKTVTAIKHIELESYGHKLVYRQDGTFFFNIFGNDFTTIIVKNIEEAFILAKHETLFNYKDRNIDSSSDIFNELQLALIKHRTNK